MKSRSDINLEREFKFHHSTQIWKGVTYYCIKYGYVGTIDMYSYLKEYNILTCFHKFIDIKDYPENMRNNYIISIGIRNVDFLKLNEIYKYTPEKCNIICVDIANG